MTVEEIYGKLAAHSIEGMMFHEQMANYYDFLGLKGYKRMHEYHFFDESCTYRSICRYFINHHNKLVPYVDVENPKAIPESWGKYTREDVDINTKMSSVKKGVTAWVDWERKTKELYEDMYCELIELGEVASALKVRELVCDVDCELKKAERHALNLKAVDYSLEVIVPEQHEYHEKFRKKMEKIGVKIC